MSYFNENREHSVPCSNDNWKHDSLPFANSDRGHYNIPWQNDNQEIKNMPSQNNNHEHNNKHRYRLSVAIDLGTSNSAMAFSFHEDPNKIYVFNNYADGIYIYPKIPTAILFDQNKEFYAFGNNALNGYEAFADNDEHEKVYLFQNFKMILYDERKISSYLMLEDVAGKKMLAMDVFTAVFKYFKDMILVDMKTRKEHLKIEEKDIHWVITVPAIWCDRAKDFMRKAAEKAGLSWRGVTICLEPEAASIYCQKFVINKDEKYKQIATIMNPKYLVVDIGGGTLDIASHEVCEDGSIKELYRASGNDLGGGKVDEEFQKLLEKLFSAKKFEEMKLVHPYAMQSIMKEFQNSKKKLDNDIRNEFSFNIHPALKFKAKHLKKFTGQDVHAAKFLDKNQKLIISKAEIIRQIEYVSTKIKDHIAYLLYHIEELQHIDYIILVGGFSNSKIIVNQLKGVTNVPVVIPENTELCVVNGAVLFGWKEDLVRSRKSKRTYGLGGNDRFVTGKHDGRRAFYDLDGSQRCKGCFRKLVTINDDLPHNHKINYVVTHSYMKTGFTIIGLFSTDDPDPLYFDVDGVTLVGEILIPRPHNAQGKAIHAEIFFGQAEIKVIVKDEYSGKTFEGNYSMLSNNVLKVIN